MHSCSREGFSKRSSSDYDYCSIDTCGEEEEEEIETRDPRAGRRRGVENKSSDSSPRELIISFESSFWRPSSRLAFSLTH